jgi:uncharacterized membrane protein YeaQ/YmgE (transglycosylase-associated protein family)
MLVSFLLFALFGFIVGAVASVLIGEDGFWESSLVAALGALIGGLVARGLGWMSAPWSVAAFLLALAGALVLIIVSRAMRRAV